MMPGGKLLLTKTTKGSNGGVERSLGSRDGEGEGGGSVSTQTGGEHKQSEKRGGSAHARGAVLMKKTSYDGRAMTGWGTAAAAGGGATGDSGQRKWGPIRGHRRTPSAASAPRKDSVGAGAVGLVGLEKQDSAASIFSAMMPRGEGVQEEVWVGQVGGEVCIFGSRDSEMKLLRTINLHGAVHDGAAQLSALKHGNLKKSVDMEKGGDYKAGGGGGKGKAQDGRQLVGLVRMVESAEDQFITVYRVIAVFTDSYLSVWNVDSCTELYHLHAKLTATVSATVCEKRRLWLGDTAGRVTVLQRKKKPGSKLKVKTNFSLGDSVVCMTSAGGEVWAGCRSGSIVRLNPSKMSVITSFQAHPGRPVLCLLYIHGKRQVASASGEEQVSVWDMSSGGGSDPADRISVSTEECITSLQLLGTKSFLLCGSLNGNLYMWDLKARELALTVGGAHTGGVLSIQSYCTGPGSDCKVRILTAGRERAVMGWTLHKDPQAIQREVGHIEHRAPSLVGMERADVPAVVRHRTGDLSKYL